MLFAPYPRLIVLHLTIVVGAFLVIGTGQPIAALILLVVLKLALDVGTQVVGRRGFGALGRGASS